MLALADQNSLAFHLNSQKAQISSLTSMSKFCLGSLIQVCSGVHCLLGDSLSMVYNVC